MGSPIPLGALLPTVILFVSLTHVFFMILLYIRDQIGKIYQSIRSHPIDTSWFLGLYVVTYVLSCSLMITWLEAVIRYDGAYIVIYLASAIANIVSLLQVSNWVFTRQERSDDLRYIEEVRSLTNIEF